MPSTILQFDTTSYNTTSSDLPLSICTFAVIFRTELRVKTVSIYLRRIFNFQVQTGPHAKICVSLLFILRELKFPSVFTCQLFHLCLRLMLKRRRNARCTAVADSVLMNSPIQKKILCCIEAILLSTDAAALR